MKSKPRLSKTNVWDKSLPRIHSSSHLLRLIIKGWYKSSPGVHQAVRCSSASTVIALQCFCEQTCPLGSGALCFLTFCNEKHSWPHDIGVNTWLKKNRWQYSQVLLVKKKKWKNRFLLISKTTQTEESFIISILRHMFFFPERTRYRRGWSCTN